MDNKTIRKIKRLEKKMNKLYIKHLDGKATKKDRLKHDRIYDWIREIRETYEYNE